MYLSDDALPIFFYCIGGFMCHGYMMWAIAIKSETDNVAPPKGMYQTTFVLSLLFWWLIIPGCVVAFVVGFLKNKE